jgi:ADP-ribose pyrophosphatase YjhB (NUDIX family)
MIVLDRGGVRFQVRAAAIIREQGYVLLHRAEGDDFWALPGGRVDLGEEAAQTVVRELHEELGVIASCGSLKYVVENFFQYDGARYHEIGYYFVASLPQQHALGDKERSHAGHEGNLALEFRWFDERELHHLDVRPSFLKSVDLDEIGDPVHRVERECSWAF